MPERADHVGQSVAGVIQNQVSDIDNLSYKYPPHRLRSSIVHPVGVIPPLLPFSPQPLPQVNQVTMSAVQVENGQHNIIERKQSPSDSSVLKNTTTDGAEKGVHQDDVEETKVHPWTSYQRLRPFILAGLALLILGWWISSIVLPATRHRWFVFRISILRSHCSSRSHFCVV